MSVEWAMSILLGHPAGNPNSHNVAAGYLEAGILESFCVPWMPSAETIRALSKLGPLRPFAERFGRREFPPLAEAPKIQGKIGECGRLLMRAAGLDVPSSFRQNSCELAETLH